MTSPPQQARPPDVLSLPDAFPSRYGVPIVSQVHRSMFVTRYFTHCLSCGYCHDWCCSHGVDVDQWHLERIEVHRADLERYTGIPASRWFHRRQIRDDEMPGGAYRRTRVANGACVFLNRRGRGCLLHGYCLDRGIDYHELKSMVDCLFPLTFCQGMLVPADEVADGTLVCLDAGPTIYRGLRDELRYYFGDGLVTALDALEAQVSAPARSPGP